MILKKITFVCLFLGSFASPISYGYDSLYWKVTNALEKFKHYDKDYHATINTLSKKAIIEPLLFSSILAVSIGATIFYSSPEGDSELVYATGFISLVTGIPSFLIAYYINKKIIERSPTIQEWIDPEKAADATYYKTQRDKTLENLKKYIKDNNISREQLDQIRHERLYWESSQKNILYDLAKDLPEK
ncbi:hypothetical protein E3J79_00710 [Candidatus Dependentiae bacterium]|nr:MAG: hypothetical protein E3J79_00710 [Candidatus Dependentiae bacterium]